MIGRFKTWFITSFCPNRLRINRVSFFGLIFGLFSLFFSPLGAEYLPEAHPLNKRSSESLIVVTLPKSGTHLMKKLIFLITGSKVINLWEYFPNCNRNEINLVIDEQYFVKKLTFFHQRNRSFISHFNFCDLYQSYLDTFDRCSLKHPTIFLLVRDLRDLFVSEAYFRTKDLQRQLGKDVTMDEMLMWVITHGNGKEKNTIWNMEGMLEIAFEWMDRPDTTLFRFEELCGPKGGGSKEEQFKAFRKMGHLLKIELADHDCEYLSESLFGVSNQNISYTFRKGQVGTWKEHFKEEHIAVFKERFGEALIKLGYEEDYDW